MFINCGSCDWCKNELTEYNLEGTNEINEKKHFCNFVCAKHYNDLIEKITLNISKYNEFFKNNKLNNISMKIFIKISKNGFEFMPKIYNKCIPNSTKERRNMCKKYMSKMYEL